MSARHAEASSAPDARSPHDGANRNTSAQSTPFASSIAGYRTPIGARHARHRPPRISHERTGTLSHAAIGAPHDGQRERGDTSDSPRGRRWTTTFRKLPTIRPKRPATTSPSVANASYGGTASAVTGSPSPSCRRTPAAAHRFAERPQHECREKRRGGQRRAR